MNRDKCMYCGHFQFDRTIHFYANGPSTGLGKCTRDPSRRSGNLTLAIGPACNYFMEQEKPVYQPHDVLKSDIKGVISIESIQQEYYPRIYRVRTTHHGGFSISQQELEENRYELIWRDKKEEEEST